MAFGFNTFSESPFAAIVENPIVQVTGQELTIAETSPGVIIDVVVPLTGQDITITEGNVDIFAGVIAFPTGQALTSNLGSVSITANADVQLFNGTGPEFSASGNAALSTDQAKFGASSLELDGTDDFVDSTSNINLSSTDFTIDVWIRPNSVTGYKGIWQSGTSTTEQSYLLGNQVYWTVNPSTIITTSVTVNANEWTMLSYERQGNTHRIYKNGTLEDTATTANKQDNGLFSIGKNGFGDFNGYIDEFRVSDIARYEGSSFTEPTSAFSVDSDTIALLHFDGADGSTDMINALNAEALVLTSNDGTAVGDAITLVDITGEALSANIGTVSITANSDVAVTGEAMTVNDGTAGVVIDVDVSLSGEAVTASLGTAVLDANSLVDVTGQELTIQEGTATADDASAEVTGIAMSMSLGTIKTVVWTEVNTGTVQPWTEVDTAA
jgi:hypothetical protein